MNIWLPVLCVFLVTPFSDACDLLPSELKVGAFYIHNLGPTKMGRPEFVEVATKIVQRFDLILIQGERDASMEVYPDLLEYVNSTVYNFTASERLGRGSYKVRYAYFYRIATVEIVDTFQYEDGVDNEDDDSDEYERDPFIALWRPVGASMTVAFIGLQVKPDDAVKEIAHLNNVTTAVAAQWPDVQNIMIAGNLAADCSYVSETKLLNADAQVYTNNSYYWAIGFNANTTTSYTDCAYDRIIVSGRDIKLSLVPCTAGIFDYGVAYNLTQEAEY